MTDAAAVRGVVLLSLSLDDDDAGSCSNDGGDSDCGNYSGLIIVAVTGHCVCFLTQTRKLTEVYSIRRTAKSK